MKEKYLWRLLATARKQSGSCGDVHTLAGIRRLLGAEAAPEVIRFHRALVQVHRRAYSWDLQAAFATTLGDCDTEQLLDGISWLILRGRTVFRRVLADPDELAAFQLEGPALTVAAGLPQAAPERLLPPHEPGEDMRVFADAIERVLGMTVPPGPPRGEPLQRDPESLLRRYPRLSARYGIAAPGLTPQRR